MTALLHHVSLDDVEWPLIVNLSIQFLHTDGTSVSLKQMKLYSNLNDIQTLSCTNLWMASCVIVFSSMSFGLLVITELLVN